MIEGMFGVLVGFGTDRIELVITLTQREFEIGDTNPLLLNEGGFGTDPGVEDTRLVVERLEFALGLGEGVLELSDEVALGPEFGREIVDFGTAVFDDGFEFLHLGDHFLVIALPRIVGDADIAKLVAGISELALE